MKTVTPSQTKDTLTINGKSYVFYSLKKAGDLLASCEKLPYTIKILVENLLRHSDGGRMTSDDIKGVITQKSRAQEIAFNPARVLMQDFTGVPAIVDLAAMRDAMNVLGGDPEKINPLIPVDLVIDHSVMVDYAGDNTAYDKNVALEYERNAERYAFLKWGQSAFKNFRVVPPGTGICHQVNLEYLAQVVWTSQNDAGEMVAYPDTVVGTDSHTTMINGLSVLGWGVGGIEAEACMLNQPLSMLVPDVVGFELTGTLPEGSTATDLVLTITNILRTKGVVGKFVEFYGAGLNQLSLPDRATVANMAPEYGATCGFFPIDGETIRYLTLSGRDPERVALVEAYAKAQGLWRDEQTPAPHYKDVVQLDLGSIRPTMAGPKRPQDKVFLNDVKALSAKSYTSTAMHEVTGRPYTLANGHVVIAAITSCTNTSNPSVMIAAGLLARKARALGLTVKPWVKTSLAPGSQIVTDYFAASGLDQDLSALGFNLVGYGCTTCIGNSGPLAPELVKTIETNDLSVAGVLSGNRNFEGRINPNVKDNFLASPPLVVAYALAGSVLTDLTTEPLGTSSTGQPIYLKDIWPTQAEIQSVIQSCITPEMFKKRYANVFDGDKFWQNIKTEKGKTYHWQENSTYVKNPPYFMNINAGPEAIQDMSNMRLLALLGDSITTDHISPAGSIKKDGPAGSYLQNHDVPVVDFNSYGARRGNHEVMMRGTFANIRLRNEMVPDTTGGITKNTITGDVLSIYDAAMGYQKECTPLLIIAGKEYGTGSSRDWAAKGTRLLGVKAVIAESFERIHRSNLVGMGVLPLQFMAGTTRQTLGITGEETFSLTGLSVGLKPGMTVMLRISREGGAADQMVPLLCRVDTQDEVDYLMHGGILPYVLRSLGAA